MNIDSVARRFPADIAQHGMTVLKGDGLFRHLRFARPDSSTYAFNLTTWPGYLAITGDCDDFVFRRLTDMFEFFRGDTINPNYWAEKAVAVSRHGGLDTFSPDLYRAAIVEHFREAYPKGTTGRLAVWQDMRWDLLDGGPSSVDEAMRMVGDYSDPNGHYPFQGFWETRITEPSYGFLWACHAIRWGIEQYDRRALPANDNLQQERKAA